MGAQIVFVVEQAGCESCAGLVRDLLEESSPVAEIAIDAAADQALVRLGAGASATEESVNRLLVEASAGTGHAYRVQPGSWRVEPS